MKAALSRQGLEKHAREKKKETAEKEAAAAEQNPEVAPEGLQEAEEEETLDDDAEVEDMAETQPVDVEWPIRHWTGWPEATACVKKKVCEDTGKSQDVWFHPWIHDFGLNTIFPCRPICQKQIQDIPRRLGKFKSWPELCAVWKNHFISTPKAKQPFFHGCAAPDMWHNYFNKLIDLVYRLVMHW